MATEFNALGFLGRWIFAIALVLGTYNPTAYCYVNWTLAETTEFGPIVSLVGIILLIAWIIYLRATLLSLGLVGIALGTALFGCLVWLFIDWGLLSLESTGALTWVGLVILSFILAVGMSWSHVRRRLTGQFDVDDRDE
ncbi:MAG: hypothetical protein ACI9JM_000316 [Halioglobus sp.]|jgi:hypothetical protein